MGLWRDVVLGPSWLPMVLRNVGQTLVCPLSCHHIHCLSIDMAMLCLRCWQGFIWAYSGWFYLVVDATMGGRQLWISSAWQWSLVHSFQCACYQRRRALIFLCKRGQKCRKSPQLMVLMPVDAVVLFCGGSSPTVVICYRCRSSTVCLGSTIGLTLFQPFTPRNIPKWVIGMSSSIKNVIIYTATYEIKNFPRFFDRNSWNKV